MHDRIDIKAVSPITERKYFVRGSTALLDTIGKTIDKIGNVQKNTTEEYRAAKVLFVITTDGMENASHEFDYGMIKKMIELKKSKYNWEFLFLGANIDAVDVAGRFGIARNRAQSFYNDSEGIALNYKVISKNVSEFRATPSCAHLSDDWSAEIQSEYKRRGVKFNVRSNNR